MRTATLLAAGTRPPPIAFGGVEEQCEIRINDRRRRVGAALKRRVPTVFARSTTIQAHPSYIDAGITHFITDAWGPDWNLDTLRKLLAWRDERS